MYHVHFGLDRRLFDDGIAQDASVFLGARQQAVIADCSVAFAAPDAVVVLTGRPGIGKTTLAGTALRTTSTRLALGTLGGGASTNVDLLEWLLTEFGLAPQRCTRAQRLQMWRQFLGEARSTDSRVFVVVEHAADLGLEGLRALAALTAADLNGCPGANLVLLGETTLLDLLDAPQLEALKQRTRLRHALEPLTREELALYVGHHVVAVGGEPMTLFPEETLTALHEYSNGIPRVVNNLADTAASLAAARRAPHVTPAIVAEVATRFLGIGQVRHAANLTEAPPKDATSDAAPPGSTAARDGDADDRASISQVVRELSATPAFAGAPEPAVAATPTAATVDADGGAATAPHPDPAEQASTSAPAAEVPILTDAVEVLTERADAQEGLAALTEAVEAPVASESPEPTRPAASIPATDDDVETLPDMGAAMARTLFGDDDLDMLGAALATGDWDVLDPALSKALDVDFGVSSAETTPRSGESEDRDPQAAPSAASGR